MLIKYIVFCLGCALIQDSYTKTQTIGGGGSRALDMPMLFLDPKVTVFIMGLATISVLAEIVVGIWLVAWWAGLFFWIPALILVGLIVRTKNPAPSLFLGIIVTLGSTISFFF